MNDYIKMFLSYSKFSFNLKKTKSDKKLKPSLLCLKLWISPAIENILSSAAEEACILEYFPAKFDKVGNLVTYVFQKI